MVDISTLLTIGVRSLRAARTALDTTAQNIANAETPEYVRRDVILQTSPAARSALGSIGTGVEVREIKRAFNRLLTDQVIDFQSQESKDSVLVNVLSEVEAFFQQSNETGIGGELSRFFGALQDVANNPAASGERTVLQTVTSRMADRFNITSQSISDIRRGIDTEIKEMMNQLNNMTSEIARLNKEIVSQNTRVASGDLRDRRDQVIRELSDLINIRTLSQGNGSVTVLLGRGRSLVDNTLSMKFVTESNASNSGFLDVKVEDVGGAQQVVTAEITGGRLGGLLSARDTKLGGYLTELDTLASTLIKQVNLIHTQGVGIEAATSLTTDYAVADVNEELGTTDSGLSFSSFILDGSFDVIVYDSAGAVTVQSSITIDKDVSGTTLTSLASALNAVSGISASVDGNTRKMTVTADGSNRFAFRNDTSRVLTAIGLNNLLKGSSASTIALGSEVAANAKLFATGKADSAGVFAVGDNSNFLNLADLENTQVISSNTQTFHEAHGALVGTVGNDVADAKNGLERSQILLNRLEGQRSGVSGVSVDAELAKLVRYQVSYSAAARLIAIAQRLTDSLLAIME